MDNRRLSRAQTLFDELLLAPLEQRSSLLVAGCGDDAELRRLVDQLLRNDDSGMAGFLTHPVLQHQRRIAAPPSRIGRYEIIREIGRGGAGVVYEARQDQPARVVALKVLNTGIASPEMLRRFEHEAEILGSLQHPGIAQVFEAGAIEVCDALGIPTTVPYFAMERVEGESITAHCDRNDLNIEGRLELFVQVCRAVQHAHTKGVIHRDIKPSNILAGADGNRRFCKIIDFGIAKLAQPQRPDRTTVTQGRQFIGTPEYMSPEQIGAGSDIDTRTDVYSLGVLLYELLTATKPFHAASLDELSREIREREPTRPSQRASHATNRVLHGDLDCIVLKCLEKDRQRRYETVAALADDLTRHLNHEPVVARPPTAAYRVRKFVRRHRAAAAAGVAVIAAIVTIAAISIAFGVRESRLRQDAQTAQTRAEQAESQTRAKAEELEKVARFQESQLASIDPRRMGTQLRRDLLGKARRAAGRSKLTTEETDARVTELEKLIAGSDFTGMALDALSENFFEPARAAIEKDFADQPPVKARLLQSLATTLQELGLLDAARGPQEEALRTRRTILGDEHRDTLDSMNNMGLLLLAQGELPEAEASFRQALDTARRVLGEDDPVTLAAFASVGVVLRRQGKLTESEPYYRESLEKNRRVLGEEHSETLRSISNLGSLFNSQARYAEAETQYVEALAISRRVLGDEHSDTLTAINNLGTLFQAQGKLSEAEPLYRESLDTARRVLGDEHPDTLRFINNIGFLFHSQQRLKEAETYYREALATRRRVLGDDHQATLNSLNNLGGVLKDQGRLAEAEACYREALHGRRRVLGPDHLDTISSYNNMGWLFEAQGKLAEAESYYRDALEKYTLLLGAEHPSTLITTVNMGSLLLARGRPADAIALLTPAEPAVRRTLTGAHTVRVGRFLTLLGRGRVAAGEYEAAEASLNEAHAILRDAVGATEQHRREVSSGLVELYDAWDAAAPERGYAAKSGEWRLKLEPPALATQPAGP